MNRNVKIGLMVLGIGAVTTGGILLYRNSKKRKISKENRTYNSKTATTSSGAKINLYETADTIARELGTNKSWFNPLSWTEDDKDAYNALKVVPKALFPELAKIYADKFKRNLRTDLNNHLDTEYYDKIKYLLY